MAELTITRFLLVIFLVLLNGFFVASEFAFVKVRVTRINELISKGSRRAKRVLQIVEDLDRSLSSTQLGITLASIALGFAGEEFFTEFFIIIIESINHLVGFNVFFVDHNYIEIIAFVTGYLVITFLHVVMGELAPKSISIQFAEKTSLICAEPLHWFMVLTNPLLDFFVWSSNGLLRLIKIPPAAETHTQVFSEEELKIIIEDSIRKGELERYESKLIFNILEFTDSNVKSILTPRIDIQALPISCSPQEILNLSKQTGYSRIPIYTETLDDIKGFVHIKDIIGFANGQSGKFEIKEVLRPVIIIPEGKSLDDLLKEMQKLQTQVSVIVDEYGSVEGIVTIEDILEYIVGPIDDEFDSGTDSAQIEVKDNVITAGGLVAIETFNSTINDLYGIEVETEEAATLAGYVLELFESEIPLEGMKTEDEKLIYTITKTSGNRIEEIQVIRKFKSETDENSDNDEV